MHGTGAELTPEWSVLLTASSVLPREEKRARLLPLLRQPMQWPTLLDLAEQHGTQPFLQQSLLDIEEAVPAKELLLLKQSCQANLHRALLLSRELIRIVQRLSGLNIEVMPYKGLALAELLYGDVAMRQAGDIDLLIHPSDLSRARDAVRDLGYTPHEIFPEAQERAYLKSGYECSFDGAAGPNLLELQWGILPRFYAVNFEMSSLFRRAIRINVAGQSMATLSPSDLFLVLSVHAAKHVWGRLIWLRDIAQLMSRPHLDWDWILRQAKDLGIRRILQVTMLAANGLLGATIPDIARASFGEDHAAERLATEVQTYVTSGSLYNSESPAYFRLMMRLREKNADRLRFLAQLAFTPGPGEWKLISLPEPLFPLYRIVRVSRLAARLVRA